ncbi:MAG: tryptophan--tRNA ligase [Fusobacteria bacterium]|nr:tryptophan--tRNA ligase [Fusobacteriota bacterium]
MKRSLSGIQPSGTLHIGNYFGAIKQFLEQQKVYNGFYFVANLHSLTSNPHNLEENTYDVVLDYLALGLDPVKTNIFLQSDVPEHVELYWYLSNITPIGLLERAHSYKDKTARGIAANHGLFSYPVLMAADILLYDADFVPVGKDQKQHLEMARDIAIKFNQQYGETFKIPEPLINEALQAVLGTDGQKMSKSYGNTIDIFAQGKNLKKQINNIVTDSKELEEPKDPNSCNIFKLYELFATSKQITALEAKYLAGNFGYGHAKKELMDVIEYYFKDAYIKRAELVQNMDYVKKVLQEGALKARDVAAPKMVEVRKKIGIVTTL